MIVISSSVVLSSVDQIDGRNPRICYHNLVTAQNLLASASALDEPVVNVANPTTYLAWRGTNTAQHWIEMALGNADEVNYFAIARHNFGTIGATVQFQYSNDNSNWTDATLPYIPNTDHVIIQEFDTVFARFFRLLITPGSAAPSVAVLYIGRSLVLQRRIYVGHTPFTMDRKTTISNGRGETGHFLGRVLRRRFYENGVSLQNLTPLWYRQNFEPFAEAAETLPFFWAWRPSQYPNECGYAWLTADVNASNQRANGMMQVSFNMQGIR